MGRRLLTLGSGRTGFSPFVDVAINGMAAMFIFLAIYVAAVPPQLPPPPLKIHTRRLPSAVWSRGYQSGIHVTGGVGAYSFSISPEESLRELRLFFDRERGWIMGTPQAKSDQDSRLLRRIPLRVRVDDEGGRHVEQEMDLVINPVAIPFDPASQKLRFADGKAQLCDAWVGRRYENAVAVLGGIEPYNVTMTGLPPGLVFQDGRIQGTPASDAVPEGEEVRTYSVSLHVVDQQSDFVPQEAVRLPSIQRTYSLAVRRKQPLSVEGVFPALARAGQPYQGFLVAHGGVGRLRWSLRDQRAPTSSAEIPLGEPGLSLDPLTGEVRGTPSTGTGVRNVNLKLQVTDEDPAQDAKAAPIDVTLTIVPPMRFAGPE